MKPQLQTGLAMAKKGLGAVKGGQKVFRWGGKLKKLPPLRKKITEKAAVKAIKKEQKIQRKDRRKEGRRKQRRILRRNLKGMGCVLLALRKRYF